MGFRCQFASESLQLVEVEMLNYLWRHRIQAESLAGNVRLWGKRLWTFPELFMLCVRRWMLLLRNCDLGPMAVVSPLCLRGNPARLRIGDGSIIGRVEIHLLDDVDIGDNVVVNDGVQLLTGSHDVHASDYRHITLPIKIEDFVWVATRSIILPGVTLGRGAVVGAGSVVARDVAAGVIVAGNPAREIGRRDCSQLGYLPSRNSAAMEAWLGRTDSTK
ncbi:Galactoside O-acetyltransferase [Rosistilla carotiformis]|uniref:Galactoside O-acetyltransferase n=1 Tax=Rosistilla carotiformis TaxID=2528017 RepID=A0A518JLD1_9BACT|nr:acyltransferase [Rosistilla carotiformis]QDV66352.1 Galactoside O-acetyltransferase [Rosistilla carotiformis]